MPEHYHQPAVPIYYGHAENSISNPTHVERIKVPMSSQMVGYGYEAGVINNTGKDYWFIYPTGEPTYVRSKRTGVQSRFIGIDHNEVEPFTLRLFRVTSLPYERIKAYRTLIKDGSPTAIERANLRYPEAVGFVELMRRNSIEFNTKIIRRDDQTADEYITYEEFVDLEDFNVTTPTYIKAFNVLIVPSEVNYHDLPLHPSNRTKPKHQKMETDGGRRIQVFDPNNTIDTSRVYLVDFGTVCSYPVKRTAHEGKAGVLIEYDNVVSNEGDDGTAMSYFIPLEESIVARSATEPEKSTTNKLWLYTSFREARALEDRPALELIKAEKELVGLKNEMLFKEQEIKERDLKLKSKITESEYTQKVMKNESDTFKLQWQTVSVFALGVIGLIKAFK